MGRATSRAERGATATEITIAAALSVVLLMAGIVSVSTSQKVYRRHLIESTMRDEATRVLDELAHEIAPAGASTVSVSQANSYGGPYITYQIATGANGSTTTWSSPITIGCATQGTDRVVRVTKNGKSADLGRNLGVSGLQIQLNGSRVAFNLSLKRTLPDGGTLEITASRKVRMEN